MKQPRSGNIDCLSKSVNDSSTECNMIPQRKCYSYSIMQYSKILSNEGVDNIAQRAFSNCEGWCLPDVVSFHVSDIKSDADIKIYFKAGPDNKFDGILNSCSGTGTTVSYSNRKNGEIYLDDHENWLLNSTENVSLDNLFKAEDALIILN